MILTITLNPAVDNAWFLDRLRVNDANRAIRVDRDAGGKGINLSRVVAELGGDTVATGFLGGGSGMFIGQVLDEQGVKQDFVQTVEETRVNFSVEDESKLPPTTFNAPGPLISSSEWELLVSKVRELSAKASWVAMAGSLPRGVSSDAYAVLGEIAQANGAKLMLDADGEVLAKALVRKPHFMKPNEQEASRLLGRTVETTSEAIEAAKDLLRLLDSDGFVIVSRGGKGAILASSEGVWVGRSPEVEVKSTMGSGDSLVAGTLWALEAGYSLQDAFRWGMASGAATASTDGTKIARRETIHRLFGEAIAQQVDG